MKKTTQRILIAAVLVAIGVLTVLFPLFSGVIAAAVGVTGILFAIVMGTVARSVLHSRSADALTVVSVIGAAIGVLLLLNRLWQFADMRYLVLIELTFTGVITFTLGFHMKEKRIKIWLYVTVAGGGAVVAGFTALWRVEAAFLTGCVTAAVLTVVPLIVKRMTSGKDERGRKIVVVKEKDIEIIEEDTQEKRE